MNRSETIQIMSVLRGAYPQFYRSVGKQEALDTVNLWNSMFADDPPELVGAAVKSIIATDEKGFPPTIGQVKGQMRRLQRPERDTALEAWGAVRRAISNSGYQATEEFARLPALVQRVVRAPEQLKVWAAMSEETVNSVIASNFQKSFRAKAEEAERFDALPGDVKALVSRMAAASFQTLPSAEPPREKALPPAPTKDKETLRRDLEEVKAALAQASQHSGGRGRSSRPPLSPEEWEQNRAAAIDRLRQKETQGGPTW